MPLPTFVANVQKAYELGKFGLKEMIQKTGDNQIKENELETIIQTMEKINSSPAPAAVKKPQPAPKQDLKNAAKSLAEKILEQKKKLKDGLPRREVEKAQNQDSTRKNYHKANVVGVTTQRGEPTKNTSKHPIIRRGSVKKGDAESGQEEVKPSLLKRKEVKKCNAKEQQESAQEGYTRRYDERMRRATMNAVEGTTAAASKKGEGPRFDVDDYTKTATAFNPTANLSNSIFQRPGSNNVGGGEDVSFTERLLVDNSMQNVAKRKGLQVPPRAMSTEERVFSKCTFRPEMYKSPQKYSNVQPRLLAHFDEPPVDLKKLPKNEQTMPSLNRSFQSMLMEPMSSRAVQGIRQMGRRSLCILLYITLYLTSFPNSEAKFIRCRRRWIRQAEKQQASVRRHIGNHHDPRLLQHIQRERIRQAD